MAQSDSAGVEAANNPKYDHLLNLFRDDFTSRLQEKNGVRSTPELAGTSSKNTNVAAAVDPLIEPNEYQKLSYHARELQEAGVEIVKKKEDKDGILKIDIDGANKSIIKMHPLYLDDTSAVMLLNFIAYEQCHHLTRPPYFTNYIVFLDCLIDNECDVEVLHKAGVLNHAFGNNNEVANLINRVGREIVCDPNYNYLHSDMEALNKFCKSYYASRLRTWWRNLIRNYFSTPWTAISLVAAVFLLILTLMQTFYAMYAYYLQPRPN